MTSFQRWQCILYSNKRNKLKFVYKCYNIYHNLSMYIGKYYVQMCILKSMNEM